MFKPVALVRRNENIIVNITTFTKNLVLRQQKLISEERLRFTLCVEIL